MVVHPGVRGAVYIVMRRCFAAVGSNRPNIRFRLLLIGGGRTFQKGSLDGAEGGPIGPTRGPVSLVWAPLGACLGQDGSCPFQILLSCKPSHVEFGSVLEPSRLVSFLVFLNSPCNFMNSPKLVEIVSANPNKVI